MKIWMSFEIIAGFGNKPNTENQSKIATHLKESAHNIYRVLALKSHTKIDYHFIGP